MVSVSAAMLLVYLFVTSVSAEVFTVPLDGAAGAVTMHWSLDYASQTASFEFHVPSSLTWFAFGFSDYGEAFPADYCVLWYDWKRHLRLEDGVADERGILSMQEHQDCMDFRSAHRGDVLKFAFTRRFDTCDKNDYVIQDGTTHIVWSAGTETLYRLEGLNVSLDSDRGSMVRVQLLKNLMAAEEKLPSDSHPYHFLVDKVNVPAVETTYWCHVHKLPQEFAQKHHVVQFEASIKEESHGLVHHMEVFHCVAPVGRPVPEYAGSCFATDRPEGTHVCKRVLATWAMGAEPFVYPKEAGLPLGGPDFNPYLMVEIHYNNPDLRSGLVDSSGMTLHVVSKLRPMDAGVIELGLEYSDKMAIPPGQPFFPLTGHCISECTAVSLPPEGITIFGSQLHTHLTGVAVSTRHFRNGRELPELNRDDHYSQHFQEIRRLKRPVTVLPGDSLVTTCRYKTVDRENVTLGGFAISDEMCVNYVHYYPSSSLEVCKSSISDQALRTFFSYMNDWENQDTTPENGVSDNYRSIEWNKMRTELLKEVYAESPLSMQCNASNGDRFPGFWENAPVTTVGIPLPPPDRQCN